MINIPKLPKLTSREELEFKEKTLLIEILDQFRNTHKFWYAALIVVVAAALPVGSFITTEVAKNLIAKQELLPIFQDPERPTDLGTLEVRFLPAGQGVYSAYAHVQNPNPGWSAWNMGYEFVFRNSSGAVLEKVTGQSFMLPGSSRFVLAPAVRLEDPPAEVQFTTSNIRWTRRAPDVDPEFTILQKRWGDIDGVFSVEGVVKNPYSFLVKKVDIAVMIFDGANQRLLAVNSTVADDLKPFEERYFRMQWGAPERVILPGVFGQVQVIAEVNPLEPGFGLPETETLPAR